MVECPRCFRPMARLYLAGGRVDVAGTTVAENGDPGGTVTAHMGPASAWAARTVSSDPSLSAGSASASGRVTLEHSKGRCKMRQTVTSEARAAAYHQAIASGRNRISLVDLKSH